MPTRRRAPHFAIRRLLANVPVRKTGKVEIAFKSPGPQPNGLQATKDGLWIIDQSAGSKAYLVDYADGRVLRSFETDTVRPSGITFDGEALWIGSTFSYENVRCNATTGAVIRAAADARLHHVHDGGRSAAAPQSACRGSAWRRRGPARPRPAALLAAADAGAEQSPAGRSRTGVERWPSVDDLDVGTIDL